MTYKQLPNSTKCSFAFLLLYFNLLSYNIYPHMTGDDSFVYYTYSREFISNGSIGFLSSISSYFGYTPFSTSAGYPLFLSITKLLTNLSLETTIFIISKIISSVMILNLFQLFNKIFYKKNFVFIATLSYCTSPVILSYAKWGIVTRFIYMYFLIIILILILKILNDKFNIRFFSIFVFFLITSLTIHRLTLLNLIILISLILTLIVSYNNKLVGLHQDNNKKYKNMIVVTLSIIQIVSIYLIFNPYSDVSANDKQRWLSDSLIFNSEYIHIFVKLCLHYLKTIGPIVMFSLLAFFYSIFNLNRDRFFQRRDFWLFFFVILTSFHLIISGIYIGEFLLIFFIIYGVYGYNIIYKYILPKNYLQPLIPILLIILLLVFPAVNKYHQQGTLSYSDSLDIKDNRGNKVYVEEDTYDSSMYLRINYEDRLVIANDDRLEKRIAAYSDKQAISEFNVFILYDLELDSDDFLFSWKLLEKDTIYDSPYSEIYQPYESHKLILNTTSKYAYSNTLISNYKMDIIVESKNLHGNFTDENGFQKPSPRLKEIHNDNYCLYENTLLKVWSIH